MSKKLTLEDRSYLAILQNQAMKDITGGKYSSFRKQIREEAWAKVMKSHPQ